MKKQDLRSHHMTRLIESDKTGSAFRVVLIEAGISKNGIEYREDVLKESLNLFEGAPAFIYEIGDTADHLQDGLSNTGLVGNLAGRFTDVSWDDSLKAITAKFNVIKESLKLTLKNAWESGLKDLIGFSIDALGSTAVDGDQVFADKIVKVNEVTLVTEPAAGGRILQLQESMEKNKVSKELEKKDSDAKLQKVKDTLEHLTESDVDKKIEASQTKTEKMLDKFTQEQKILVSDQRLTEAVSKLKFSDFHKDKIKEKFKGKEHTVEEMNKEIKDYQDHLASLTEGVKGISGQEKDGPVDASVKTDQHDKNVDALFNLINGTQKAGDVAFNSFRESYSAITGNYGTETDISSAILQSIRFALPNESWLKSDKEYKAKIRQGRLVESALDNIGLGRFKESLETSTWAEAFGDSMKRILQLAYTQIGKDDWRKIVNIRPTNDFRTLRAIRVGGFGTLPIVAEGATYPTVAAPSDEEATYNIQKRGELFPITMEAIANDDLSSISRTIKSLGRAASNTLYKFVFDLVRNNTDNIYDGNTLYDSSHNNDTSSVISATSLKVGIQTLQRQRELDSNEQLGISPAFFLAPNQIASDALEIFETRTTTNASSEIVDNVYIMPFNLEVITPYYWGDQTLSPVDSVLEWYMVIHPNDIEGIQMSFFRNQQDPMMLVQDSELNGSNFTADKVTWKIRHIYGGAIIDFRPFFRGNSG